MVSSQLFTWTKTFASLTELSIGTRHIKVWRVEDARSASPTKQRYAHDGTPQPVAVQPALKTLSGRNVLLGPLVESTFTTAAAISDRRAIVCSEKGDICLVDANEAQKLMKLANIGYAITCIAIDVPHQRVQIGGRNGKVRSISLDDLLTPTTPPDSPSPRGETVSSNGAGHLCAIGYKAGTLISIDSKHSIELSASKFTTAGSTPRRTPFPAHGDAVLGVRILPPNNYMNATFLTWSADGNVIFWDLDGRSKAMLKVEIEQLSTGDEDPVNQCLIVRASQLANLLVIAGDKYGSI